METQKL